MLQKQQKHSRYMILVATTKQVHCLHINTNAHRRAPFSQLLPGEKNQIVAV